MDHSLIISVFYLKYFKGNQIDCQSNDEIEKYYAIAGNHSQLKKVPITPNCETYIWKFEDYFEDQWIEKSEKPEIKIWMKSLDNKVCTPFLCLSTI